MNLQLPRLTFLEGIKILQTTMQENHISTLGVALDCPVSTEEQREGQTIDSQVAEPDRFARENKWLLINTYKYEDWSGSLLVRPALDRLRAHARYGGFQVISIGPNGIDAGSSKNVIVRGTSWDCVPYSPVRRITEHRTAHLFIPEPTAYPQSDAAHRRGYPRIYEDLAERLSRNNFGRRGSTMRASGDGTLRTHCESKKRFPAAAGSRKTKR